MTVPRWLPGKVREGARSRCLRPWLNAPAEAPKSSGSPRAARGGRREPGAPSGAARDGKVALRSLILRALGREPRAAPWDNEESIREELFSAERLEQHARSLAAAQPVVARSAT